jgi:hypothetical protein
VSFTAELGTSDSMPGNIALGYQLVTVTSVTDSGSGGAVAVMDAGRGGLAADDDLRYDADITDARNPG